MTEEEKKRSRRRTLIMWLIILILLLALLQQRACTVQEASGPELGKPGTEYFNEDPQKQSEENLGKIGASIPASLTVQDGKVMMTIKNIGDQAFIPYTLVNKSEIYRASRVIEPGSKVSAVLSVGDADKCVTYVETLKGEKFSITTKLVKEEND